MNKLTCLSLFAVCFFISTAFGASKQIAVTINNLASQDIYIMIYDCAQNNLANAKVDANSRHIFQVTPKTDSFYVGEMVMAANIKESAHQVLRANYFTGTYPAASEKIDFVREGRSPFTFTHANPPSCLKPTIVYHAK